jgi:hypothetical protein
MADDKKPVTTVLGGKGGLPPAWVLAGLEAPAGTKDMGSWKAAVYTAEQQARLGVDETGHKAEHKVGIVGPAWTRGEIEAPAGTKDMGSWTAAAYTAEQQARLGVDEYGHKKPVTVLGGKGGLPPAWVLAGLEAPAGTKDMGSWTAAAYTAEQQARLGVDETGHKAEHKVGIVGPAWTRGEIEPPAGTKNMGSWTAAVYTAEQQTRLGVDEFGHKKPVTVLGGKGGLPPAWILAGLEPPAGSKDMGTWTAAVYTAEQQARLGVDEAGHKQDPKLVEAAAKLDGASGSGNSASGGSGLVGKLIGLAGPAWTRGEVEPPAGTKNMGSWTAAVYTEEQQARLNVDEFGHKKEARVILGGKGGIPPAWVLAGLEPPAGEEDHGSFKTAVYTAEQQARLKVDSHGNPASAAAPAAAAEPAAKPKLIGGSKVIGPAWTRGEIEAPAGTKNMGTWTAAVYTEEQQARLNVDEYGHKHASI